MGGLFSRHYKPDIFHPTTSAEVTATKARGSNETFRTSVQKLIEERCPTLFSDFQPPWWLAKYVHIAPEKWKQNANPFGLSGHLQTLYCVVGDFTKRDLITYSR
jgi:hypothetical protein